MKMALSLLVAAPSTRASALVAVEATMIDHQVESGTTKEDDEAVCLPAFAI